MFRFVDGITLVVFPPTFFLGGGRAVLGATFDAPRGGWLEVPIGFTGVKKTYDVGGGLGGVLYQTGRPNVKPRILIVTMTGVLMILDGGNRKGIC